MQSSRKSNDERGRKEFKPPVSRRQERILAQVAESGLSALVAED